MRRPMIATTTTILVVVLALLVSACGTDVVGTYVAESDDPEFQTARLVLKDDETFRLSAQIEGTGETVVFTGTWSLDGETITLAAEGLNETETGTVESGEQARLVFDEVTWVRE